MGYDPFVNKNDRKVVSRGKHPGDSEHRSVMSPPKRLTIGHLSVAKGPSPT